MPEVIVLLAQLALVAAALWYTIETRKLRIQSESQMDMLRRQGRLSVAPFLVPGLVDVDLARLRKKVEEDTELSAEERRDKLDKIDRAQVRFVCAVQNPTTKLPHHCQLWVYDAKRRSFLLCDAGKEVIPEKETMLFQVSEPSFSLDECMKHLQTDFGTAADFAHVQLKVGTESYIALFFQDLEGRVYMIKRPFGIHDDGDVVHKPSVLFFDAGFQGHA